MRTGVTDKTRCERQQHVWIPQTENMHATILLAETFLDLLPVLAITKVHFEIRERGARTSGINLKRCLQRGVRNTRIRVEIPS